MSSLNVAICGGGIGGLSAAIALRQAGHGVTVFEKTRAFNRVGADINLTPNAVFAVDRLGVGDVLRKTAARPTFRISRDGGNRPRDVTSADEFSGRREIRRTAINHSPRRFA